MLLGFVFVVMGISFVQQRRSERSLEALRDLSSPRALVIRDGEARRIAGREVVLGDIVLLAEGDRVPGDMRLVEASNLAVDESMLTGESAPVLKKATHGTDEAAVAPDESDPSKVYSGTLVTRGTARGCVEATGARSALGRIGASLAGIAVEITPIQRETRRVIKWVAVVGSVAGCRPRHRLLGKAGRLAARPAGRPDTGHGYPAGRTARGAYAFSGAGCVAVGAREGAGPKHSRRRTVGRDHCVVCGQDGDADRQSHGGPALVVGGGGARHRAGRH